MTSFRHHNNNQILQMFTININLPLSCKIIAKQTGLGILELLHCNIYNCILKNHHLFRVQMVEHLVFANIGLFRPTTSKRHTGLKNWQWISPIWNHITWEEVQVCQLKLESLTVQTVSAAFLTDNV